jgi:hypothetical protein
MKDEDQDWKERGEPSDADGEEEFHEEDAEMEEPEIHGEKRRGGTRLLTCIQVFGSLAVLAAAIALRVFSTDWYQTVRAWYLTAVNDSIVAEEQMDQAKRTVVGLWNNISSAGPQPVSGSSSAPGSQAAAGQSSQAASGSGAQNSGPASSAAGKAPDGGQQSAP